MINRNRSIFTCLVLSIFGILISTPIIGSISTASATTASEDQSEVPQQQQEDGGGETTTPPSLTASITLDSTDGDTAPATFLFETGPEGGTEPYTYSWDFGDGSPQANERNIEHTFGNPGTYVVSLTVTDSTGQTVSDTREVTVRPATVTEEPQVSTNTTTTPTPPQPTEPGPTQNQTQVEQNQTQTTGAVESVQCPAPLRPTNRPIDLRSGNGAIGGTDSLNLFSTTGSAGPWSPAFIVAKDPNWANPLSGTQYISSDPNRQLPTSGDIWYKVEFTLPSGFKNPSLTGKVHADNQATIFLNNPTTNQIGQQTPQYTVLNFLDPAESFGTTSNSVTGKNVLYFRITNVDMVTGFDYNATVTYCLEPNVGGPVNGTIGPSGGTISTTPAVNVACPANNIQHWDKIVFQITDSRVAGGLGFITDTPLDIKVLDDPKTVADIEKKVLDFLKLPDNPQNRNAIFIVDVEYAIICAK